VVGGWGGERNLEKEELYNLIKAALGGVDEGRQVHLVLDVDIKGALALGQDASHLCSVPLLACLDQLEALLCSGGGGGGGGGGWVSIE